VVSKITSIIAGKRAAFGTKIQLMHTKHQKLENENFEFVKKYLLDCIFESFP